MIIAQKYTTLKVGGRWTSRIIKLADMGKGVWAIQLNRSCFLHIGKEKYIKGAWRTYGVMSNRKLSTIFYG